MPFIGVHASAKIVSVDGQSLDLWGEDQSWVTGVSISFGIGFITTITATIDMPYKQGLELLESGWIDIKNFLLVRVGYSKTGFMSPWYSGILTAPNVSLSPNGLQGSLVSHGAAAVGMVNGSGKTWSGTPYDVIEAMKSKYGWHIDDPQGKAKEILEAEGDWNASQARMDDWSFVKDICESRGVQMWGGNDSKGRAGLSLRSTNAQLASQPVRTFVMMGGFDIAKNQYPVISFNVETDQKSIFASGATRGTRLMYLDDEAEEQVIESSPSDSVDQHLGGSTTQTGTSDGQQDPDTGAKNDATPDAGGADDEGAGLILAEAPNGDHQAFVDAVVQDAETGFPGVVVSVTTIGVPVQYPAELVGLRGASTMFDGTYMVKKVDHQVNGGGFETTWTGIRNALTSGSLQDASNQNTLDPLEDGESEEVT